MSITLPVEQIQAFIEREYDLRLRAPLADMQQGVHSQAWLASTDDGRWVVKASNPVSDPAAKLQAQSVLYRFLNEQGVNAPVIRADLDGYMVTQIEHGGQSYPCTLMRYHEMRRFDPLSLTQAEMEQVVGMMARLHHVLKQFPGAPEIIADRTKSQNEWGKQTIGVYNELVAAPMSIYFTQDEQAWLKSVDANVVAYIDAYFPAPESLTYAILHGDFSFDHVRLLPNGRVYLFDFGDLNWGPVAHELGVFVRSFRDGVISPERWVELRQWLIESYRAHGVLTAADVEAIDLFILNRIVAQARYILELSGDEISPGGVAVIKLSYTLAASMLAGRHRAQGE